MGKHINEREVGKLCNVHTCEGHVGSDHVDVDSNHVVVGSDHADVHDC
jgi:hypothetical protein